LLNEVSSLFDILKYVCDIVVKQVHVRYLISWWVVVLLEVTGWCI